MMQKTQRSERRASGWPAVCLISLGCEKNTVDSERILAALIADGFLIAGDPMDADICLVNTCGFIADAREETAATLRELAAKRRRKNRPKIVAIGCLVERAGGAPECAGFLAQADTAVGFADFPRLPEVCRAVLGMPSPAHAEPIRDLAAFHALPRLLTGPGHTVSLKISEGCSNACRFCTIPAIRGPQISRPPAEILAEARDLIRSGVREICVIGQDTTSYGRDLGGGMTLAGLMRDLSALEGGIWLRLMYAHPRFLSDGIFEAMEQDPRWQPYLDLPLQHIADPVLRAMGRGMGRDATLRLLDRIRARRPDLCIRTAFIVGHPGETDADFESLLAFVREGRFLHVGVFAYSEETGTPSARMAGRVPPDVAIERRDRLMQAQRDVSRAALRAWVGRPLDVLLDDPAPAGDATDAVWFARHGGQAPEVDGRVILRVPAAADLHPGDIVPARIDGSLAYDLRARVV